MTTHALPQRRAKGFARAGARRQSTKARAALGASIIVLDLAKQTECTGSRCRFLAGVECIPAGGAPCTPDGAGNVGVGNAGGQNFGAWQGRGGCRLCQGKTGVRSARSCAAAQPTSMTDSAEHICCPCSPFCRAPQPWRAERGERQPGQPELRQLEPGGPQHRGEQCGRRECACPPCSFARTARLSSGQSACTAGVRATSPKPSCHRCR